MSLVPTTLERNRDLAKIHACARNLGMSEFQCRALQFDVTGTESCLYMSAEERAAVIAELQAVAGGVTPDEADKCLLNTPPPEAVYLRQLVSMLITVHSYAPSPVLADCYYHNVK